MGFAGVDPIALEFMAAGNPGQLCQPVVSHRQSGRNKNAPDRRRHPKRANLRRGIRQNGTMRSASQGAFYILRTGDSMDSSDCGGSYDRTTVDKTARVVVTVEYNVVER